MNTEKRGSEKLIQQEGNLCSLTEEEVAQVSGGASLPILLGPGFPLGTLPPDIIQQINLPTDLPGLPGFPNGTVNPNILKRQFNGL